MPAWATTPAFITTIWSLTASASERLQKADFETMTSAEFRVALRLLALAVLVENRAATEADYAAGIAAQYGSGSSLDAGAGLLTALASRGGGGECKWRLVAARAGSSRVRGFGLWGGGCGLRLSGAPVYLAPGSWAGPRGPVGPPSTRSGL